MDPSMFFGKTRTTRQTLKSKQQTASKETENCEVNKHVQRENCPPSVKERRAKSVIAGKENDGVEETTSKRTSKRAKQPVKKNEVVLNQVKDKSKPVKRFQKVHFEEQEDDIPQKSPSRGGNTKDSAPSGPVYQNVRRSDVVGDPLEEYDFPVTSDSSSEKIKKKKTTRRAKPVKKAGGVVMWDPSKRPIIVKAKPTKKTALQMKELTTTSTNGVAKSKLLTNQPTKACSPKKKVEKPGKVNPPVCSNLQLLPGAITPDLNGAKPFTSSTPVLRQPSSKKVLCVGAASNIAGKQIQPTNESPAAASTVKRMRQELPAPSISMSCAPNENFGPESPSAIPEIQTPTSHSQSTLKPQSAQVSSRRCSFLPLPQFSIRESPSFRENSQVLESPHRFSVGSVGAECPRILDAVTSTPVTRSRKNNGEALKSATTVNIDQPSISNAKVSCSPVTFRSPSGEIPLSTRNESDRNMSGIFDDMPRTSVIPTRMFSTNRGTIYIPEGQNVLKRKMPELSPAKEQSSSRATVVKFSTPQTSDLEQCFGFEDMDDFTFVPQRTNNRVNMAFVKKAPVKKPNLSIQEVQAILRGQSKLASPANITPRSVQTKLTDFVSSTPTSTPARTVPVCNGPVLTPTPVPLFDEDKLETDLVSPFSQVSIFINFFV